MFLVLFCRDLQNLVLWERLRLILLIMLMQLRLAMFLFLSRIQIQKQCCTLALSLSCINVCHETLQCLPLKISSHDACFFVFLNCDTELRTEVFSLSGINTKAARKCRSAKVYPKLDSAIMSFFLSSSCKSLFFLGSYWESLFCCGLCRVVKESDSLVKRSRSQDLKSHLSIEADEIHKSDSQEVQY